MSDKKVYLSSPTMHEEEQRFISEAFEANWIAPLGANVDGFEREMCEYLNCDNALATISGTSAIHLAVKLAGVKKGDVVLCSDLTFSATVNPVVYQAAVPVFIDSEPGTWNMDPNALEAAFQKYPNAKAVIVVDLYGTPAKLDEISDICLRHNAVLIEDAAEGLSALYQGKKLGTFGEFGILSFNGNKIITTSGGGMLITKTKEQRDTAFFYSTQAREQYLWYEHKEIGFNYRMSNIVAGIGRGQLMHIDEHKALKKKLFNTYSAAFAELPLIMNPHTKDSEPNFWLSCIKLDKSLNKTPKDIIDILEQHNFESRYIWKPMHMQPVYRTNDYISLSDNLGEDVFKYGVCLPSDIKMTEEAQAEAIDLIKSVLE